MARYFEERRYLGERPSKDAVVSTFRNGILEDFESDFSSQIDVTIDDKVSSFSRDRDSATLNSWWGNEDSLKRGILPGYVNIYYNLQGPAGRILQATRLNAPLMSGIIAPHDESYLNYQALFFLHELSHVVGASHPRCQDHFTEVANISLQFSRCIAGNSFHRGRNHVSRIGSTLTTSDFHAHITRVWADGNKTWIPVSLAIYEDRLRKGVRHIVSHENQGEQYVTEDIAAARAYMSNFENKIIHIWRDWARMQMWLRSFTEAGR